MTEDDVVVVVVVVVVELRAEVVKYDGSTASTPPSKVEVAAILPLSRDVGSMIRGGPVGVVGPCPTTTPGCRPPPIPDEAAAATAPPPPPRAPTTPEEPPDVATTACVVNDPAAAVASAEAPVADPSAAGLIPAKPVAIKVDATLARS